MLKGFPTPYPDELLYSVLARYHIRRGNTSPKATLFELFNSKTISAVIDMPCGIDALISNMPLGSEYTSEYIIKNHTMYPYYTAFLPRDRRSLVYSSMKSNFGGDIHNRSGIMASSIETHRYLRYCSKCNEEDLSKYGEYYWHRMHQVPCLLVCSEHNCLLQDSTVLISKINKHEFVAASNQNCFSLLEIPTSHIPNLENHIKLASDTLWIFHNYETIVNKENFYKEYLPILQSKGLASANGRVYQKDFTDTFIRYYGKDFLLGVQSDLEYDFKNNWLSSIVRKHRKSFHPIRHLLVIRYLLDSLEIFFEKQHDYIPFGEGPWPCLNAAANHYLEMEIKTVSISQCIDTKLPVGTFNCSCGFIYSRRGHKDYPNDLYKIGRIKNFGSIWENKLKELVEIKKLGLRESARQLNVDPNTAKRHAKILGLKASWNTEECTNVEESNEENVAKEHYWKIRSNKRDQWNNLIRENPDLSTNQIRKKALGLHSWLYKNDNEWLKENQSNIKQKKNSNNRVDWQKRDEEILEKIKSIMKQVHESNLKPERVTRGMLGREIGSLTLLERHLDKMPLTQGYINSFCESKSELQEKRIIWAANQLKIEGEELKKWKIFRLASIKPNDHEEFNMLVESILGKEFETSNNRM